MKTPFGFNPLDLTVLTRNSDKVQTKIRIGFDHDMNDWITCGEIRLRNIGDSRRPGRWEIAAHLLDAVDFEHDSAFVFRFELVGVEFHGIDYQETTFSGWVRGDTAASESFRVSRLGYNPFLDPRVTECKDCDEPHPILPEEYYVPPFDNSIFAQVGGQYIEVTTGPKS